MKKIKIKIPLYMGDIIIIQDNNMQKIINKYGFTSYDAKHFDAFAFRNPKKGYSKYYLIFKKPTNARIVAHECLHAIGLVFEDRGIIMDIPNDEPQAYLLGWFVSECTKFLNINNKKL